MKLMKMKPLLMSLGTVLVFVLACSVSADEMRTCQADDFHYEYTECDSTGGRWRVSVPTPSVCIGGAPNAPIRGKDCSFTCGSGQFLDIQGDQECHPCQPGTYSLGGGIRFDDWTSVPVGFSIESDKMETGPMPLWGASDADRPVSDKPLNCSQSGWQAEGEYMAVHNGPCSSSLVYAASLVKPGTVQFEYQFNDASTFFHFSIQNDKCQTAHDKESSKWPKSTKKGEWKVVTMPLKTGVNVLYWKRINFGGSNHGPVFIRKIEITGVAYTSQCTKCKDGTFSPEGAISCSVCKENTYSTRGAIQCTACDPLTEYSGRGAGKCEKKPPCKESDYYLYNTPCDGSKKTKTMHKWILPQICRTDLPDAVQLPAEGKPKDCPPCNPGMEFVENNGCVFCPANHYSDGSSLCKPCPGSTSPNNGYYFHWWNTLPLNVTTACFTMDDSECEPSSSWIPAGDHIHSGIAKAARTFFILNVNVGEFVNKHAPKDDNVVFGEVKFVFELNCTGKCIFTFAEESSDAMVIKSWEGAQVKQEYRYKVTELDDYVFSFAFRPGESKQDLGSENYAKIFSIEVTNIGGNQGGASSCRPCPRGVESNGCIPCPEGNYVDENTAECKACPENTVILGGNSWGRESCKSCGAGLQPDKGTSCATNCKFTNAAGREYDFTQLGKYMRYIDGSRLFTSTGTQYLHGFNISLCAGGDFPLVTCINNVTFDEDMFREKGEVKAAICRATMIPARMDHSTVLSTQPASLGDFLEKIVTNHSLSEMYEQEGFPLEGMEDNVHFHYRSESPTAACKDGRRTIISMRCDIKEDGNGTIDLPPKCSDGTCDGCTFHFLWRTQHACPLCQENDYEVIVGECVRGTQTVHYVPPKGCVLLDNNKLKTKARTCSMLPFAIEISILVGIGVGIIMCGCLVYCWKKNRKLEYKYSKLVQGSIGKDGEMELPAVDSCGLDEDEEEDQFDSVHFKESKGKRLFNKFKAKIGGKEDDNPFESITLSEKQSLT